MNKQCSFLSLFKAEHYKTKNNIAVWVVLLIPSVIIVGTAFYIMSKVNSTSESSSGNLWISLLGSYSFVFFSLFFPLILAIFCQAMNDLEYKNNCWKQLFTLPVHRSKIFYAKILYISEIVFLSLCTAYAVFLLSGYILSYILPHCGFQDYDIRMSALIFFGKCLIGSLAITYIQFLLSLVFKKFVLPIGIACFFLILSLFLFQSEYRGFIPYISLYISFEQFSSETLNVIGKNDYLNMGYITLSLTGLFSIFVRAKI